MHYGGIIDVQRAQISIAPLRRGIKLSFGVRGGSAALRDCGPEDHEGCIARREARWCATMFIGWPLPLPKGRPVLKTPRDGQPPFPTIARSLKGGESVLRARNEWRLWRGLRTFPRRPLRSGIRPIEASKAASRNGCFTSTPAVSRGAICDKKILAQRETWGARFLWRVPACADFVPRPRPSLIRGPIREFGKARALLLPPP
jgi:hypothetical protein